MMYCCSATSEYMEAVLGYSDHHSRKIEHHYAHAIEKHPYFCDWNPLDIDEVHRGYILLKLDHAREMLKYSIECGNVEWKEVLDCEIWEAFEALVNGDKAHAVEELYDMIAVCLRTIDVLEGRQKLGKPEANS